MEAKNNNKNGMNVIENVENEVMVTLLPARKPISSGVG